MKIYLIIILFLLKSLSLFADKGDPKTKKEFLKHKLKAGGELEYPLTMFDKNESNFNWQVDIDTIRLELKSNDSIDPEKLSLAFQMYKGLFDNANEGKPGICSHDVDNCLHPQWVKANALVCLIGIKIEQVGSVFEVTDMDDNEKNVYAEKAKQGLTEISYKIPACIGGGNNCPNVRQRSMQLISYLQSYDVLKTVGYISNDINTRNDSPRENLRKLSSELYQASSRIINSNLGWKKNHGIICCAGLGYAAIILGEAGGRKDKYDPNKWMQRAHGRSHNTICFEECDDGLEDNFFVGRQAGNNVPTTNEDGTAGFSEGPAYFLDLSHALFPYMRCNSNYYLDKKNKNNLLLDNRYIEILDWFYNILNVDGSIPQYDNSSQEKGNIFGILGLEKFNGNPTAIPPIYVNSIFSNIDLRGDYLLSLGFKSGQKPNPTDYSNSNSGNNILFDETSKGKFTLHALYETGVAVDKPGNSRDGTHEDEDFGSFTIEAKSLDASALNMPLIIDPGFGTDFKYKNFSLRGYYGQHNTFEWEANGGWANTGFNIISNKEVNGSLGNGKIKGREIDMNATFMKSIIELKTPQYMRSLLSWNFDNQIYYTVRDMADESSLTSTFKVNITGNGTADYKENGGLTGPNTFRKEKGFYIYSYPCFLDNPAINQWRILQAYLAINNNSNAITEWHHTYIPNAPQKHETDKLEALTKAPYLTINIANDPYYNKTHTQLELISNSTKIDFISIYVPIKCNEELPLLKRNQRQGIAYLLLAFKEHLDTSISLRKNLPGTPQMVWDTSCHFHLIKETNAIDTIINPFKFVNDSLKVLTTDGKRLFVNYRSVPYLGKGIGYCEPVYTNFRSVAAWDTKLLCYQNDTLFKSSIPLDIFYGISTKNKYDLSFTTKSSVSSSDSIHVKLFGVERGKEMIALLPSNDTFPTRYDSISKMLAFKPKEGGPFKLVIEPKNICQDCYFPPLGTNFDTLFLAIDGQTHSLGNSKKINYNHGNLSILNSTKINMCPGVILHNKDSIIIEGPEQSDPMFASSCAGIDSLTKESRNSMLTVSPYSALVLDAGSYTYIKNGGGLYIKQNGSLVIKSGALVEVGDSGRAGFGEIIAEPGAFIYIEDNANIRYRRIIGKDTFDNNIINFAVGNGGVIPGVQYYIDSILKAENILPPITYPIAICALDTINPIGNKYWGYTNFGKPDARLSTKRILCPN